MPESLWDATKLSNMAGEDPEASQYALQWAQTRRRNLKALRTSTMELRWIRMWRAYEQMFVGGYYQGTSRIELPTIYVLVERLIPRLTDLCVGREDFFETEATRGNAKRQAELIEALLKAQMEKDGFRRKFPLWLRDAVILGTGISKTRWRYDVRPTRTVIRDGEKTVETPDGNLRIVPKYRVVEQPTVLYDGPSTCRVDLFNIAVNPRAQDIEDTDVCEDIPVNLTDVHRYMESGVFAEGPTREALENLQNIGNVPIDAMRTLPERAGAIIAPFPNAPTSPEYLYYELWCDFPLGATNDEEARKTLTVPCVLGVLGDRYLVRFMMNPSHDGRKPYNKCVVVEKPGEFYGLSLVEKAIPLAMERNDARNQANDSRIYSAIPLVLMGPSAGTDQKDSYTLSPGKVIRGNGVQLAHFPDQSIPVMRAESQMLRDLEDLFGAPALFDGQSDANTATESVSQQTEATARFRGYAHAVEDIFIRPILSVMHGLNRQFITTDTTVRMLGQRGFEWRPLRPDDLQVDVQFLTTGASSMTPRSNLVAQFAAVYDRMSVEETVNPGFFDKPRFWSDMFRALGIEHPSLYIRPLRNQEKVPTVEQVHVMLSQGQNVEPDPRQDFFVTLPQYAAFIDKNAQRMTEATLMIFLEHFQLAVQTAQEVIRERQQQMVMAALAAGPSGPPSLPVSGSNGGRSNQKIDDRDRDGRGLSTGRQAAKNARPVQAGGAERR